MNDLTGPIEPMVVIPIGMDCRNGPVEIPGLRRCWMSFMDGKWRTTILAAGTTSIGPWKFHWRKSEYPSKDNDHDQ